MYTKGDDCYTIYSMKVDIWSDIVCPFCYIGDAQFKKALSSFAHEKNVEVVYHSFQLMPDAPSEPTSSATEYLAAKKSMPIEVLQQMQQQVSEAGANEGLVMNMESTMIVNTFNAHRFIHFATTKGKQHQAVEALHAAYFTKGVNVADTKELQAVAKQIGLSKDEVAEVLESTDYTDEVNADINQAKALGIQGVPFFVVNEKYGISGAQGVEVFNDVLQKAWHQANPLTVVGSEEMICKDGVCT